MATAAALLASLADCPVVALPDPETLGEILEPVVRLQLVKCRPVAGIGQRGAPSQAMCQDCPPRFLWKELDYLQPEVLVAFGNDTYRTLDQSLDVRWRSHVQSDEFRLHRQRTRRRSGRFLRRRRSEIKFGSA